MRIGLLFGSFSGGGAERMMVNLAKGFIQKGHRPIIYVINNCGAYEAEVPSDITIVDLDAPHGVKSVLFKIRNILKENKLDALISTQEHINGVVGLASIGIKKRPKIIFREANTPSQRSYSIFRKWIYKYAYRFADKYVAVSNGVKNDIIQYYGSDPRDVSTIYNPVVDELLFELKDAKVEDPWFREKNEHPIVVGMGRVTPQKGFEDLIEALAHVREEVPARLMIFGNTDANPEYFRMLKKKVKELELEDCVRFPGFVDNPFKYLRSASLFVLSSKFEGLPGVLIQALACGCPVVSTDCPSGPREILKGGKFGELVSVGDPESMFRAMVRSLNEKVERKCLIERGLSFNTDRSVKKYLQILI